MEYRNRLDLIAQIRLVMPKAAIYNGLVAKLPLTHQSVIRVLDAKKKFIGYSITTIGQGAMGPLTLLVGFSGNTVTGVYLVAHSEAQGIGALVTRSEPMTGREFSFLGQFRGKHVFDPFKPGEDIVALPDAPLVSKGICEGVHRAVRVYRRLEHIIE